jgi:hypothetical protein
VSRRWLAAAFTVAMVAAGSAGAAIVRPTPDTSPAPSCWELPPGPSARNCYRNEILAEADTVVEIIELVEVMLEDPADPVTGHFVRECHEVSHEIGRLLEQRAPIDVTPVPYNTCLGGLAHGAYEVRMEQLSDEELVAQAPTWCGPDPQMMCRHLIGHVAMLRALDSAGVDEALGPVSSVCAYPVGTNLEERSYLELYCLDGAYMQWMLDGLRYDSAIATDDPFGVCADLVERNILAAQACFRQSGPLVYETVASASAAFDTCTPVVEQFGRVMGNHCLRSMVANVISLSSEVPADAARLCPGTFDPFRCLTEFDRIYAETVGMQDGFGLVCATLADPDEVERCRQVAGLKVQITLPDGTLAPTTET